ncbi:3-ketodihydrosphingosine reductase [Cimex lectularius]|uniref:3-dehydrosphinganine reductase n=1 Tax=Cimex lectularius TaxID=79782 RepID=A0A8I6S322_CIMLE|nr:3-ketodihydrosphingosine reductase [Cimex lectularius]XP_014256225.1 3-ketodihydrosphingosine reductase [Cimex lectularius]
MLSIFIEFVFNVVLFLCCFAASLLAVGVVYIKFRYKTLSRTTLKNKHVVITGGSSGIGKGVACEAAKRGANVTIIARDKIKLVAAKNEIAKHCVNSSQRIHTYSLDVSSNFDKVDKAFVEIEQEVGPIYMLVNCAGSAVCGKLEDLSKADIKKMFDLNCLGSIFPTKAVIEGMKARGEGYIVFVASQAAQIGIFGLSAYSASKFALRGFAEALNMEVKAHGIKVTISFPPDTDTPGFAEEEKSKPKETRLISQTSGLYSPAEIALKLMNDTLAGYFISSYNFEGFMMYVLCAGMSPYSSFFHLLLESLLMGIFRIVGGAYLISFDRIVMRCMKEKNHSKKAE